MRNYMDLFPRTNGAADIQIDVSSHVETVCCLYHQKKDFISVPYEPNDTEYLKNIDDRHHKNTGMICTKRTGGTQ